MDASLAPYTLPVFVLVWQAGVKGAQAMPSHPGVYGLLAQTVSAES